VFQQGLASVEKTDRATDIHTERQRERQRQHLVREWLEVFQQGLASVEKTDRATDIHTERQRDRHSQHLVREWLEVFQQGLASVNAGNVCQRKLLQLRKMLEHRFLHTPRSTDYENIAYRYKLNSLL